MNVDRKGMKQKIPQASYMKQEDPDPYIIIKVEDSTTTDLPVECCTEHSDLFLLDDEELVKPGDKFKSHNDFVCYLNDRAKRWLYYYSCSDSRKPNTEHETYTYSCVYLKNREKYMKKGLRKRTNNLKTDCPCKIRLRRLPNEKELTVVFVCNHHDHELSQEQFNKLQHGRRLPPYIKEEIMDLLYLRVSVERIRQYVQIETGFNMSRPFFYGIEKTMKMRNTERQISESRLQQLTEKMNVVEAIYTKTEPMDDQDVRNGSTNDINDPSGSIITTKSEGTRIKRGSPVKRRSKSIKVIDDKRIKLADSQNVTTDDETLQCVMNLEESIKCETVRNPWVTEQAVPTLPNRMLISSDGDGSVHVNILEGNTNNKTDYGNIEYLYDYCDETTAVAIKKETPCELNDSITTELSDTCIAYETVVTEPDGDCGNSQEVGNGDDSSVTYNYSHNDDDVNDIETEYDNDDECNGTQEMEEIIEYVNSDGEIIDYSPEDYEDNDEATYTEHAENSNDDDSGLNNSLENEVRSHRQVKYTYSGSDKIVACDAAVQTSSDSSTGAQYFLPVFDVYMKDGNVTGFVVNNDMVQNSKNDGTEKSVQTESLRKSEYQSADDDVDDNVDPEPSIFIEHTSKDTFTKHEYIHKYNIEQYMVLPHFPKYIETLAKQTNIDVLKMFTAIYNEKAMFKMTTTQRGKEGNTTIWYISNTRIRRRSKGMDGKKRELLGKSLRDVLLLKEQVKLLKQQNYELETRNTYLEEVALRVAKLG